MNCVDVREALLRGDGLPEEAVAHAATCPVCGVLARKTDVGRDDGAPADMGALFEQVSAAIARERGPVAWLRSRPSRERMILSAAWAFGLIALVAALMPRTHFAKVPVERAALVLASLAVLLALSIRFELRPLQLPPPSPRTKAGLFVGGLLLPIAFAFLPVPESLAFTRYTQITDQQATIGCFIIGCVTGALFVAGLSALDRGKLRSRRAALFAGVMGGVAGNLALELHCPITSPAHLLLGHATVGFALLFACALLPRSKHAPG